MTREGLDSSLLPRVSHLPTPLSERGELVDIRDYTTLFSVILKRESSELLESSIESDFGMHSF